jgi:fructose-1,6-bisphosphatase/inositol monophosphatase family enzyme
MAAGIVLVREAGGLVSRMEGDDGLLEPGTLVVSNATVHAKLAELLRINL